MICRLQLIQLLYTVCSVLSPRRGFGGLSPEQSSKTPNWNVEHYGISVELFSIFRISSSPAQTQSSHIENFLATVLSLLLIHLLSTRRPILPKWNKSLNTYVRSGIASLNICMRHNVWF